MFTFFGGVLLLVALISGAYPALYVSSFTPVKILRGKEKFGSKSLFSKIIAQFSIYSFFYNDRGMPGIHKQQPAF